MSNAIVPTAEQDNVVMMAGKHSELLIEAYAGAAKSSTLVMVAEENPVNSILLTFNKALAVEAASKFPSWVTCKTTHSLAYGVFGVPLQHKLSRPRGAYRNVAGTGSEVAKYFKTGDFKYILNGVGKPKVLKAGGVGVAIKETVAKFEQSADDFMTRDHVSLSVCDREMWTDRSVISAFAEMVFGYAKQLWKLRINPRIDVLATHDTYLKLYQLSKPDLSRYEIIYLDECQDTNAVVLDIFLNQQGKSKLIAVGDAFQNIYSWRGTTNAMLTLDWPKAKLSKSFRWGQEVGDIADCVLATATSKKQTDVKGWEKITTHCKPAIEATEQDLSKPYTVLFRTNSALIFEAVSLLEKDVKVNLEIDVSDFVKLLDSAIELHNGNMAKVKHEKLVQFDSWEEFVTEAEAVQGELMRVCKMIESKMVYKVLGMLAKHKNHEHPDVTLITAHGSKGREWDTVVLGEDFPSGYNAKGEWVGLQDMERNLLYVALTRAKCTLLYNEPVQELIERMGHSALSNKGSELTLDSVSG